jgi:hypothetical protein
MQIKYSFVLFAKSKLMGCVIKELVLLIIINNVYYLLLFLLIFVLCFNDFVVFLQLKGYKDLRSFQYYPVRYHKVGR